LTSPEEVAEKPRREPARAVDFTGFADPHLQLGAAQYATPAAGLGLRELESRSTVKRWDFGAKEAFFGFCNAGFGAGPQVLPLAHRHQSAKVMVRRDLAMIEAAIGERWTFHFMQTDVLLAPA
jgi:trans-aconitate 2-methyltransferase